MIVLVREVLPGCIEHGAARTALGVEASRRVGVFDELARDAGTALALRLDRRRFGVPLLTTRRQKRRVVWRLRRRAELGFELGDAGVQRRYLREQFGDARVPGRDLHQQLIDLRQHRRFGAAGTPRFVLSLPHGECESPRRTTLNTSQASHNAADG
jgi:hypothetical protein